MRMSANRPHHHSKALRQNAQRKSFLCTLSVDCIPVYITINVMNRRRRYRAAPRRWLSLTTLLLALVAGRASGLDPTKPSAQAVGWRLLAEGPLLPAPRSRAATSADFRDRALILCWHSFLADPKLPTDFSLDALGAQLDALSALGYRFPSLAEALAGRLTGRLNIVVTIDDGHRTVPRAVEKVFAPRGIEPALFIYPAVIGTTSFSMGDAEIRRLVDSGHMVGAHGYHHLYVTEELWKSDRAAFEREIYKAREKTGLITARPVLAYAYPFGAFSPRTKTELSRAGYAFGLAVKPGFVYTVEGYNDELELPRLVVTQDNWKDIYALLARNAQASGDLPKSKAK